MTHFGKQRGFTLIELSIVLVIIGLIVGGVLVGRDLIKAASVRAQISQIEKINAAVMTFRLKYKDLPGDIPASQATSFGLYAITTMYVPGSQGLGDGNRLIEGRQPGETGLRGEVLMFFRHLSEANLIDGNYAPTGAAAGTMTTYAEPAAATSGSQMNGYFPIAKIGNGASIIVGSPTGIGNALVLSAPGSVDVNGVYSSSTNPLSAQDAYNMDSKIDNGLPGSGTVFAIDGTALDYQSPAWTTISAVGACISSGAYALNQGAVPACSLRFKLQ